MAPHQECWADYRTLDNQRFIGSDIFIDIVAGSAAASPKYSLSIHRHRLDCELLSTLQVIKYYPQYRSTLLSAGVGGQSSVEAAAAAAIEDTVTVVVLLLGG